MSDRLYIEGNKDALKGLAKTSKSVVSRAIELVAFALAGFMKDEAPFAKGNLRDKISWPEQLGPLEFGINIDAPYWRPVQFGAKPHVIYPRTKKALAFTVNGDRVVCAYVFHPGNVANPFIDRAIDRVEDRIDSAVDQALQEAGL